MQNHIVTSFDSKIAELVDSLKDIKNSLLDGLSIFSDKLSGNNTESLSDIAEMAKSVEKQAVTLIALRNPMADDLRFIISAIKIATIYNNISQQIGKNIEIISSVNNLPANIKDIMAKEVKNVTSMVKNSFKGYKKVDISKADKVLKKETRLDKISQKFMDSLPSLIRDNLDNLEDYLKAQIIIKKFERIGDNLTVISDVVRYIDGGELI